MFLRLLVCSLVTVSPALALAKTPSPEKVVQAIGAELRSAQTIGDWINKSSPKNKLFRRTHFSKYTNEKMPQVIVSGTSLLVFEKNKSKKPSVLRVSAKADQLVFTWNGYDITKPKNMNLEKWFGKKFPRFSRTAQWFPANPFVTSAHAQVPTTVDQISQNVVMDQNSTSYWTAVIASMSADDWENFNIEERRGSEDARTLADAGRFMREQYKLSCSQEGEAGFDFPFEGDPSKPLRIGATYDATKKLARVSIVRIHKDPSLKAKMGEIGRIAYNVMGVDDALPGANIGKAYLFNGHTKVNTEHDSLREGNLLSGLYTIINTTDRAVPVEPNVDTMNAMYDMTQGVVALADFARACCSNAYCRDKAELPSNGTGVSQ